MAVHSTKSLQALQEKQNINVRYEK